MKLKHVKQAKERNAWLDEVSRCRTNLDAFNYLIREKPYVDIVRLFGSYWRLSTYLVGYYELIVEPERNGRNDNNTQLFA